MALKDLITTDEFNALPEGDRVLYIKKDGENGQPDSFGLHPLFISERTALSTNNQRLKTEKQTAADQLKAFQELGLTADQISKLKADHEAAEAAKLTEEQKKQKAEDALKLSHQKEIERLTADRKAREDFLTRELRKNMIEAQAKIAVEKAGVIEGGSDVLLPHLMAAMDMLEEGDGENRTIVTRIIDPTTRQPRYVGSDFMTADQFVEELKQRPGFGGVFKAAGVGGGGATVQAKGATAAAATIKRAAFDQLDVLAQREFVIKGGKIVD